MADRLFRPKNSKLSWFLRYTRVFLLERPRVECSFLPTNTDELGGCRRKRFRSPQVHLALRATTRVHRSLYPKSWNGLQQKIRLPLIYPHHQFLVFYSVQTFTMANSRLGVDACDLCGSTHFSVIDGIRYCENGHEQAVSFCPSETADE